MIRRALVVVSNSVRQLVARQNAGAVGLKLPLRTAPTVPSSVAKVPAQLTTSVARNGSSSLFFRQPFGQSSLVYRMQQSVLGFSRGGYYNGVNYARLGLCNSVNITRDWSQVLLRRDLSAMSKSQLARCCQQQQQDQQEARQVTNLAQIQLGPCIATGSSAEIFACRLRDVTAAAGLPGCRAVDLPLQPTQEQDDQSKWPLICKRNFTYQGQTYSLKPEILPLHMGLSHPGIVQLYSHFLAKAMNVSEFCQPTTQHVLMKRYSTNLSDFLENRKLSVAEATSILLQLLEADILLKKNNVAHRDIKADNVLLTEHSDGSIQACLADFGCSLNRASSGDIDYREGNSLLTAPEIHRAEAGPLDYSKADVWALGSLAYQLFGQENPFYAVKPGTNEYLLDSKTYRHTDLPPLTTGAPPLIARIVSDMLEPNPANRPTSRECADLLHLDQLFLLRPGSGSGSTPPLPAFSTASEQDVVTWLLCCVARDILATDWMAKLRAAVFYERSWSYHHLVGLRLRHLNLLTY